VCFNSSVGILVVRTRCLFSRFNRIVYVSIPRSEFWSFGPDVGLYSHKSDNKFQFLGRNSGRSDAQSLSQLSTDYSRFNSSVGILVVRTKEHHDSNSSTGRFQFLGRNSGRSDCIIAQTSIKRIGSFNSSVGILVVRTRYYC